jgi:pre-mRNA-splicing helicase BRR2
VSLFVCCNHAQVLDCAGKHQVLIFVHSRKETAKTAQYLKQTALDNDHLAKFMRDDSASREILQVRFPVQGCCCMRAVSWFTAA